MILHKLFLISLCAVLNLCYCDDLYNETYKWPTVDISILVRNKEAALPYFLTCLQQLDYPKDRLYIWIYSDFNEDSSLEIVEEWAKLKSADYKIMHLTLDRASSGLKFSDQKHITEWTPQRFQHIIRLREKALRAARNSWSDYIFMLDADAFLTNPNTLKALVKKNLFIVAPMLLSDGLYSNFWDGMTDDNYYRRTINYDKIVHRKEIGCLNVSVVHTAVLISLRHTGSDFLTYDPKRLVDYTGPYDDIITFARNAQNKKIDIILCNDQIYGFVPIPVDDKLSTEVGQVDNLKLEVLGRGIDLPIDPALVKFTKFPSKTKYGLDEVFLINLERRTERKNLMMKSFDILGLDVKVIKGVDGKRLTDVSPEVTLMPNYEDPYHKRPMKVGEVGCFMSHYNIWLEIAKRHLKSSLVLEDDVHFGRDFRERFEEVMTELKDIDWELVYIGRKVLMNLEEEYVTDHVTKPLYSYWTLGYLLSEQGARKLIGAEPLSKMLPVDEFLPIMFDQHPNKTWKSRFTKRNLKAFSAAPLLVHPTHYTGEPGYISDTEDSKVAYDDSKARAAFRAQRQNEDL